MWYPLDGLLTINGKQERVFLNIKIKNVPREMMEFKGWINNGDDEE